MLVLVQPLFVLWNIHDLRKTSQPLINDKIAKAKRWLCIVELILLQKHLEYSLARSVLPRHHLHIVSLLKMGLTIGVVNYSAAQVKVIRLFFKIIMIPEAWKKISKKQNYTIWKGADWYVPNRPHQHLDSLWSPNDNILDHVKVIGTTVLLLLFKTSHLLSST